MELNNPSMNNIYDSTYFSKIIQDEQNISNDLYEKAKNPLNSGVVSRYDTASSLNYTNPDTTNTNTNTNKIMSLTGETFDNNEFKHNNMTPFLRGNITQNTNVDNDNQNTRLQINTGNNIFYKTKKEVESLFNPTANYGNVFPMNNNNAFYKDRIIDSKIKNNTFPLESVKVAPGLNKGYTSEGSGGFQQSDTVDYAVPRSMDELRSKINQKNSTFTIPFQGPSKGTEQRGNVVSFDKNKPETVYETSVDNLIRTTGQFFKEKDRPNEILKDTYRNTSHKEYSGNVNIIDHRLSLNDDKKKSIMVYDNVRNLTETKTTVSNVTSIIKSMIAPILDVVKLSNKEYTIEAPRPNGGNIRTQIPEKATLYDPVNHIMKTTIKETTIHDSENINLKGPEETYSALYDTSKTTIKETTIHDSEKTNLKGPNETYSALYDTSKTTIKETTIHDSENINLKGPNETYSTLFDITKTTTRETTKPIDTVRNIGNIVCKVYEYDPKVVAKTTTKQTTIIPKSNGFIGGIINKIKYFMTECDIKNTHKQFTSDNENYGIPAGSSSQFIPSDRTSACNAESNDIRENILINAGHTPNGGGKFVGVPKENICMDTKKQTDLEITPREFGNVGKIINQLPNDICDNGTKIINKENAYKDRLDTSILDSLNYNDLKIKIN